MTADTALIEKREELKRRLEMGEYRTLIDVILDGTSRITQKVTRNPHPISPWYSITILYLILLLVGFAGMFLMGDTIFIRNFATQSVLPLRWSLLAGYFSFVIMVAGNIYIHHVFTTFHDSVLDIAESIVTLDDFERWVSTVCNRKAQFIVSIVGSLLVGIYSLSILHASLGLLSPTIVTTLFLLVLMSFFAFLYSLFCMVVLAARIGQYDLKLYATDPTSSEVVSHLAGLLSSFMYIVAMFATAFTLYIALSGFLRIPLVVPSVVWLSFFWIPIIAMFLLNQNSLSSIIRRAKWKTLNEIQAKIEKLHASEKLGEKDTMETINRLMDYYDRIKNTRSSRIDFDAVLNLINSLLLPLLALVLGNIDKILALFK